MKKCHDFLMPDYYPAFSCKMGACRHACCDEIVDVAAGAYRLIDHSDFDRYAAHILKKLGCSDHQHLGQILCI